MPVNYHTPYKSSSLWKQTSILSLQITFMFALAIVAATYFIQIPIPDPEPFTLIDDEALSFFVIFGISLEISQLVAAGWLLIRNWVSSCQLNG